MLAISTFTVALIGENGNTRRPAVGKPGVFVTPGYSLDTVKAFVPVARPVARYMGVPLIGELTTTPAAGMGGGP
jgi:hypothetical protein